MWRLIPLLQMTARMFFYSAAVFTAAHGVIYFLYSCTERCLSAGETLDLFLGMAQWSAIPALALALPLPLVTALCFREIRRPVFYRFAMLAVALVATIVVWEADYVMLGQALRLGPGFAEYAAGTIAGNALAIFMSVIVADKYVRDIRARRQRLAQS